MMVGITYNYVNLQNMQQRFATLDKFELIGIVCCVLKRDEQAILKDIK